MDKNFSQNNSSKVNLNDIIDVLNNNDSTNQQLDALCSAIGIDKSLDDHKKLEEVTRFIEIMSLRILKQKTEEAVNRVTNDPIHAVFNGSGENKLYTDERRDALVERVVEILNFLDVINMDDYDKINAINQFLKTTVSIRGQYFSAFEELVPEFDEKELKYRTAYSALLDGQSMCAGYAEACRILCEASGLKTHTLLSRLPGKNKHLIHYVTLVTTSDGSSFILDPEREASCERKGIPFYDTKSETDPSQNNIGYQNRMTFFTPTFNFFDSKIGSNGVGPDVDVFIKNYFNNNKKDGSALFQIADNGAVYIKKPDPTNPENERLVKCKNLNSLLDADKFVKFIGKQKAVFMVHGTKNIGSLDKIMNVAEKALDQQSQQSSQNENIPGLGE